MVAKDEIPTLPSVQHERTKRKFRQAAQATSYSFLEALKYYSGTDADLIWGPFYKRVRAARHNARQASGTWTPFSLKTIWSGVTTQKKPGAVTQLYNWIAGVDSRPTFLPPAKKEKKTTDDEDVRGKVESWQHEIGIRTDWSPTRIDFAQWYGRLKHPADYNDDFYKTTYRTLYDKIVEVSEVWFGAGVRLEDLRDSQVEISAWEAPMTEQFQQYARLVAHEDSGYVEWKDILNDPRHRKWLCVSILAQIIEKKIFTSLLFGASGVFHQELERHDKHWVLQEGFTRKEGRRQIARAALGSGLVPDHFWDAVDSLACQTVLIFQPLLSLVALGSGRSSGQDQAIFYQEVHTILAMAGYFQVCMAVSPSIFHILSASPGSRFQWEEEAHADYEIYQHSKGYHMSHEDRWRVIAQFSSKGESSRVSKLTDSTEDNDDTSQYQPFPANEDEYRLMDHKRRRGGKVMYAVFPKLTRYSAENVGELILDIRPATSHEDVETGEGMRISILSRCLVVYYQGLIHSDRDDGNTLDEHLEQLSWNNLSGRFLPHLKHSWANDGSPTYNLYWPLWPASVDRYWLHWTLYVLVDFFFKHFILGIPYHVEGNPVVAFFRHFFVWFLVEIAIYHTLKTSTWGFFNTGDHFFGKVRILGYLTIPLTNYLLRYAKEDLYFFSILAVPLVWLDKVLLNTMPRVVLAFAGVLEHEDTSTILSRLFARNATAAA